MPPHNQQKVVEGSQTLRHRSSVQCQRREGLDYVEVFCFLASFFSRTTAKEILCTELCNAQKRTSRKIPSIRVDEQSRKPCQGGPCPPQCENTEESLARKKKYQKWWKETSVSSAPFEMERSARVEVKQPQKAVFNVALI